MNATDIKEPGFYWAVNGDSDVMPCEIEPAFTGAPWWSLGSETNSNTNYMQLIAVIKAWNSLAPFSRRR